MGCEYNNNNVTFQQGYSKLRTYTVGGNNISASQMRNYTFVLYKVFALKFFALFWYPFFASFLDYSLYCYCSSNYKCSFLLLKTILFAVVLWRKIEKEQHYCCVTKVGKAISKEKAL